MSTSKTQTQSTPGGEIAARHRREGASSLFTRRVIVAGLVAPILAAVFSFAWALLMVVGGLVALTVGGAWAAPKADVLFEWYVLATYGLGAMTAVVACWAVWPSQTPRAPA